MPVAVGFRPRWSQERRTKGQVFCRRKPPCPARRPDPPRFRPERSARHRLRPERELPVGRARRFHEMKLCGVRKACADEHLPPLRMPALQRRRAEFQVAPRIRAQFRRERRDAVGHEIFRHLREERGAAEQEGEDGKTVTHPALLTARARQASFRAAEQPRQLPSSSLFLSAARAVRSPRRIPHRPITSPPASAFNTCQSFDR